MIELDARKTAMPSQWLCWKCWWLALKCQWKDVRDGNLGGEAVAEGWVLVVMRVLIASSTTVVFGVLKTKVANYRCDCEEEEEAGSRRSGEVCDYDTLQ